MKYEDVIIKENNCFKNDNEIIYSKKKKRRISKTLVISVCCFSALFTLKTIDSSFTNDLLSTFNAISQVGKPTAELFDEDSNVFFVSFFNSISLGNKLPLTFKLPVVYESFTQSGNTLTLKPASKVVVSGYDGQIKKIAVEDEKKVLYIEHSGGLISRYENLDCVGVVLGQIVKQGGNIGTVKEGQNITLSFSIKGEPVVFEMGEDFVRFVV